MAAGERANGGRSTAVFPKDPRDPHRTAPLSRSAAAPAAAPSMARLALMLGAFVALGPLTIDMYLPALPTIRQQLGTTSATVQLTLTGTLVGLALGQLVIGPLSDTLGRRRPLLAGTALHVVASLLVLVAPNIAVLGVLRVLQGVGTAATAVVALAIVRDLFDGRAAATMLSRLFLVMGVAPVLAPTIGGEILRVHLVARGLRRPGRVRRRRADPGRRRPPRDPPRRAPRTAAGSPTRCGPTARCSATAATSG